VMGGMLTRYIFFQLNLTYDHFIDGMEAIVQVMAQAAAVTTNSTPLAFSPDARPANEVPSEVAEIQAADLFQHQLSLDMDLQFGQPLPDRSFGNYGEDLSLPDWEDLSF
jgi:hypothetical protein